ncbi:MAG TPA: hypothetical protein V6C76_17145 [Drouetiella sp.]
MAMDASRIKSVRKVFSVLAALSISISANTSAFAFDFPEVWNTQQTTENLIARFPFRKAKDAESDGDKSKKNSSNPESTESTTSDSATQKNDSAPSDSNSSKSGSSTLDDNKAGAQNESADQNAKSADQNSKATQADSKTDSVTSNSKDSENSKPGKQAKGKQKTKDSKKDSEQAKKNKELSKQAAEDAKRDNEQSKKAAEQAKKAAEQAKKSSDQDKDKDSNKKQDKSETSAETDTGRDNEPKMVGKDDKKSKESAKKADKDTKKTKDNADKKQSKSEGQTEGKGKKSKSEAKTEEKEKKSKSSAEQDEEQAREKERSKKAAEQAKKENEKSKKAAEQANKENEKSKEAGQANKENEKSRKSAKPTNKDKSQHDVKSLTGSTTSNITTNPVATSAYQPDTALLSLLNDLARALREPAEQSKFGDENQKMVVSMAAEVLTKALDSNRNANRIVEKQTGGGASMNAEAWSSGDIKVSDDCRGSLAAVWAKRENGLLNVTIAGTCKDKTAPNGKKVGEYVVVLSARSSIQKGFDIQSQSDVRFWLAKLATVNVDADCCAIPDGAATEVSEQTNQSGGAKSETRELQQHALVVLQTVVTERQRSSLGTIYGASSPQATPNKSTLISVVLPQAHPSASAPVTQQSQSQQGQPLLEQEDSKQRASKEQENSSRKAAKEQEDSQRKAAKEQEELQRKAAKEREAQEKQAAREREKEDERLASEDQRRNHAQEKLAAQAEKDSPRPSQDDFAVRDDYSARRNARYANREDMILEEATRQVEAERSAGIDTRRSYPSERMTSENMKLAEASKKAEDDRREAADMRAPHSAERMTRDDMILAEATREAEAERREALIRSTEQPQQVAIGDSRAALRPTLSSSGKSAEVAQTPIVADADTAQTGYGWEMRPNAKQKPSRWAGTESEEDSEPATSNQTASDNGRQIASTPPDVVLKRLVNSKLILPQRCIAGQYITAAVTDSKNEGQDGIELNFNGVNYTTDEHGQVAFMVPDDTASGAKMSVGMTELKTAKRSNIEVLQPLSTSSEQNTPSIEKISNIVSANGPITLDGHSFDGIAHRNRVTIDDMNDAEVLAASPVQLKVAVPNDLKPGKHAVAIDIGLAKSNAAEFDLITTEVVSDPRDPNGKLIVRVLGTTNKTSVHVLNKTPEVIKITKGNDLRTTTTGGDNNNLILPILRLRKGSYRVTATVD